MSLLTPAIAPSPIARANPVGKLAVALLISVALLLSIDLVSAAVALGLELLLLPVSGIAARVFWLRTVPLWFAAPLAGTGTLASTLTASDASANAALAFDGLLTSALNPVSGAFYNALATGTAWVGHGSDLGGSLRTPAAFCAVVGFRPTPGRVATDPGIEIERRLPVELGEQASRSPEGDEGLDGRRGGHLAIVGRRAARR